MTKNEYMIRNKRNKLDYKNVELNHLIKLTEYMTSVCVMMRPDCERCKLSGDALYCPSAAAERELKNRGYDRIEVIVGLSTKPVYTQNITPLIEHMVDV